MRTRRIIEITIETRQVTIIRRRQPPVSAWCAACAEVVEMLTAEQAALVIGQSVRAIYRQVEQGRFHFNETAEGRVSLCLNSVLKVCNSTAGAGPQAAPLGQTFLLTERGEES